MEPKVRNPLESAAAGCVCGSVVLPGDEVTSGQEQGLQGQGVCGAVLGTGTKSFGKIIEGAKTNFEMNRATAARYLERLVAAGLITSNGGLYWKSEGRNGAQSQKSHMPYKYMRYDYKAGRGKEPPSLGSGGPSPLCRWVGPGGGPYAIAELEILAPSSYKIG